MDAQVEQLDEYEWRRSGHFARLVAEKRKRRLDLRDATLQFENQEIVLFQLHERLRADAADTATRRRPIIDEHRMLLPRAGELRAALFIDGSDARRGSELARALESARSPVSLCIDSALIGSDVVAPSVGAVHYLRFCMPRTITLSTDSSVFVQLTRGDSGQSALRRFALSPESCLALAKDFQPLPPGTT